MRRRLDFVIPDRETARKIEDELLLAKIEDQRMHFLAKEDTDLGDMPKADMRQKMDLIHGMQTGLIFGAIVGFLVGIVVYILMDVGFAVGAGLALLLAILGGLVGSWASGMLGTSIPNTKLKKFEGTIAEGHILLMVDVPLERVDEISAMIKKQHPDVEYHGVEPTTPAFP